MFYPVKLDKVRNFRFGMKAISLLEKKFKKPIASIDMGNLTMDDLATFIWAGLQHEDRNLTPDKVMDLVDEYSDMKEISEAMHKAFAFSYGGDEQPADSEETEKNV